MTRGHRIANLLGVIIPFLGFIAALALLWHGFGGWRQVLLMGVLYLLTGTGLTVGFHRLLAHRAFATSGWMRCTFAVLGSMAVEGPVISWVANHRKHHAYADQPGDPHSPQLAGGQGVWSALAGLYHAHLGWMFTEPTANRSRFAPDLQADRAMRIIDRLFGLWVALTLLLPAALGLALTGTWTGALSGLLFGGLARVLLLHHVTFAINSLRHFLGSRKFATRDQSRNLAWLAPISFGEGWHHNHHAFPTSAFHGLRRREIDPGRAVIKVLERAGLAWNVVRVSPERQRAKALEADRGST